MNILEFNPYRRKRPKVDASIFDSALSHIRRSDASEKREENSVSTFGRFRLWISFESSPVSVKLNQVYTHVQIVPTVLEESGRQLMMSPSVV